MVVGARYGHQKLHGLGRTLYTKVLPVKRFLGRRPPANTPRPEFPADRGAVFRNSRVIAALIRSFSSMLLGERGTLTLASAHKPGVVIQFVGGGEARAPFRRQRAIGALLLLSRQSDIVIRRVAAKDSQHLRSCFGAGTG